MFKVLTFVRVVCLWFAFWWQSYALATPTSVNLLISNPRGGFGDTAASLLMTERLAQSFFNTDTKFSVVYQDGAKEQLHTLWPEFNPELDVQLVRGILFSSVKKAQVAEFGITFSSVEEVPKTVAQVSLVYHEYEELEQKGSSGLFSSMRSSRDNGPITGSGESVDFNTGFSKGVYVLDGFRPDDFDKRLTFQFLSKFARLAPISNSTKLGYAYASSPELVQQYVRAMEKFNLNKNDEIVIVTNHPVETKDPRIRIINMKGLPFNLNQKVIKSSDVPILVTGDGSLSLAIEGRKPFFYSLYAWKRFTPEALRKAIEKVSPALRKDRSSMDLIATLLRLDTTGNRSYEDLFLKVMENPALQAELARVYDTIVKTDSLVSIVQKDMEIKKSLKSQLKSQYRQFALAYWNFARKYENPEQAVQKMEKFIFDSKKDVQQRISYFVSLKTLNNYSEQRFADLVSKALIYGDVELKSAMAFVIHDAHSAYDFIQLHPLLTPPAQKEFILILKNLAGQDRSQWGPYAAGAERALLQLSAQADKKNSVTCEGVFK